MKIAKLFHGAKINELFEGQFNKKREYWMSGRYKQNHKESSMRLSYAKYI